MVAKQRNRRDQGSQAWLRLTEAFKAEVPQLTSVITDEVDFIDLRVKLRDDGSCLAIVKRYSADGGPVVCFGAAYGAIGALVAIDRAITGNNWKVDKPWSPDKK